MITFLCFRWGNKYKSEHVNVLRRMLVRNLSLPHELVCATDNASGLDSGVRPAPLERQLIGLGNAYPKLAAFRPDAASIYGGTRLCVIDLDCILCGNLDGLFARPEPFIIWRDALADRQPARFEYNTSLILMDAGSRSEVWNSFNPRQSPQIVRKEGRCGSDQAWVSRSLNGEAAWSAADGVLSWRFDVGGKSLPRQARIVFFHGREKPWTLPNEPLVRKYWN